jgi:hypothetical protein
MTWPGIAPASEPLAGSSMEHLTVRPQAKMRHIYAELTPGAPPAATGAKSAAARRRRCGRDAFARFAKAVLRRIRPKRRYDKTKILIMLGSVASLHQNTRDQNRRDRRGNKVTRATDEDPAIPRATCDGFVRPKSRSRSWAASGARHVVDSIAISQIDGRRACRRPSRWPASASPFTSSDRRLHLITIVLFTASVEPRKAASR